MIHYSTLYVRLSNSQINKLKSVITTGTGV